MKMSKIQRWYLKRLAYDAAKKINEAAAYLDVAGREELKEYLVECDSVKKAELRKKIRFRIRQAKDAMMKRMPSAPDKIQ